MDPLPRPRTTEPAAVFRTPTTAVTRDDIDHHTSVPNPSMPLPIEVVPQIQVYRAPHLRNDSSRTSGHLPPPPTANGIVGRTRPPALKLSRSLNPNDRFCPATAPAFGSRLSGAAAARGLKISLPNSDIRDRHTRGSATLTPTTPGRKRGITVGVIVQDELVAESEPLSPAVRPTSAFPILVTSSESFPAPIGSGRPALGRLSPRPVLNNPSVPKVRKELILCRYYHTPGLTCTSSPCRFVHNIEALTRANGETHTSKASASFALNFDGPRASATPHTPLENDDPTRGTFAAAQAAPPGAALTLKEVDIARLVGGETVLVDGAGERVGHLFKMSGGGKGASGKTRLKFRTVPCKDFATGECAYGDYCSFIHDPNNLFDEEKHGKKDKPKTTKETAQPDKTENNKLVDKNGEADVSKVDQLGERNTEASFDSNRRPKSSQCINDSSLMRSTPPEDFEHIKVLETCSPPLHKFFSPPSDLDILPILRNANPGLTIDVSRPLDGLSAPPPTAHLSLALPTPQPTVAPSLPSLALALPDDNALRLALAPLALPSPPSKSYPWTPPASPVDATWPDLSKSTAPEGSSPAVVSVPVKNMPSPIQIPKVPTSKKGIKDVKNPPAKAPVPRAAEMEWPWLNSKKEGPISPQPISAWTQHIPKDTPAKANEPDALEDTTAPTANLAVGQISESDLVWTPQGHMIRHRPHQSYRTKVCKFFGLGGCNFGNSCGFLHTTETNAPDHAVSRSKNIVCVPFNQRSGCPHRAEDCEFAHLKIVPADPLRPVRRTQTRLCRHFAAGRCHMGDKCFFLHVDHLGRPVNRKSASQTPVEAPSTPTQPMPLWFPPRATTVDPVTTVLDTSAASDGSGVPPSRSPLAIPYSLQYSPMSSEGSISVSGSYASSTDFYYSSHNIMTPAMTLGDVNGYFGANHSPAMSAVGSPRGTGADHCAAWAKSGTCPAGESCPLSHIGEGEYPLTEEALAAACERLRNMALKEYDSDGDDDDYEITTSATTSSTRTHSPRSSISSPSSQSVCRLSTA